jgi:tRNA (adenine58-N1)-methyltransferase non-catalytic subunit
MSEVIENETNGDATVEEPMIVDGSYTSERPTDDPLLAEPSLVVREGDWVILAFADGKRLFAQCLHNPRGKAPCVKIQKRHYPTFNLIGLPYGAVLEQGKSKLIPLDDGEELLPDLPNPSAEEVIQVTDNRHLIDTNSSQSMNQDAIFKLRNEGTQGSAIVAALIENSATFDQKTEFSKAKYIARKQKKHQPRCRIERCTGLSICEALYMKDAKKIMNLREDTLGQMLSYANVSAGCQALVFETCMGIVTGALAQRMGGYGKILSVYTGQQPAWIDQLERFNLTFPEQHSIKWVHNEDVFGPEKDTTSVVEDPEAADRDLLQWPCPLQDHTRGYLDTVSDPQEIKELLAKRCDRFARKLTRTSPGEAKAMLNKRPSDCVIIATKCDPTETLLGMMPFLGTSCPFVVFCEFMEPLSECFMELQKQNLAINLRLSDTWFREYQVLPGRTHPNMTMSQNGGFILTGIKLDPVLGVNEMNEEERKKIRDQIGGRRGKSKTQKKRESEQEDSGFNKKAKTKE